MWMTTMGDIWHEFPTHWLSFISSWCECAHCILKVAYPPSLCLPAVLLGPFGLVHSKGNPVDLEHSVVNGQTHLGFHLPSYSQNKCTFSGMGDRKLGFKHPVIFRDSLPKLPWYDLQKYVNKRLRHGIVGNEQKTFMGSVVKMFRFGLKVSFWYFL